MTNQHLLSQLPAQTILADLCGLQAQFFGNVMHSLKIRGTSIPEDNEGMMKNWTLRGTMHVFSEQDLPLFLRCGNQYRSNEWSEKSFWNQRRDWALSPDRQKELSAVILQAMEEKSHTREELKQLCREYGMTDAEERSMFHPWGGGIRELCERGFLHYAAQEEKVFRLSPVVVPLEQERAELELARRYFTNFAPATIHDAMYFFRVSAARVKKWLEQLPVHAVVCEGKNYYYIEAGHCFNGNIPDCLYLAGFDQLMLGYEKKESLYLRPEDMHRIFNRAGIVMPALLLRGEVAGMWKENSGVLTVTIFRSVSDSELAAIKAQAEIIWPQIRKIDIRS